ncbi:MAG: hypothetical protein Q9M91_05300 [Candidatus Dojkabacteria bacterium]|nr:hypothetical protein [Candidatus Dojkabacteria bacterium]MDQ7021220.1 hypothetical protein [Candidatus Dojkabacteria bacterium]
MEEPILTKKITIEIGDEFKFIPSPVVFKAIEAVCMKEKIGIDKILEEVEISYGKAEGEILRKLLNDYEGFSLLMETGAILKLYENGEIKVERTSKGLSTQETKLMAEQVFGRNNRPVNPVDSSNGKGEDKPELSSSRIM